MSPDVTVIDYPLSLPFLIYISCLNFRFAEIFVTQTPENWTSGSLQQHVDYLLSVVIIGSIVASLQFSDVMFPQLVITCVSCDHVSCSFVVAYSGTFQLYYFMGFVYFEKLSCIIFRCVIIVVLYMQMKRGFFSSQNTTSL